MEKLTSVLSSLNKPVVSNEGSSVSIADRKTQAQNYIAEIERLNLELDSLRSHRVEHAVALEKSRDMAKGIEEQLRIDQKAHKLTSNAKEAEIKALQKLFKDDSAVKSSTLVALASRPVSYDVEDARGVSIAGPAPPYVSNLYPELSDKQSSVSGEMSVESAKPVLVGEKFAEDVHDSLTPPPSGRARTSFLDPSRLSMPPMLDRTAFTPRFESFKANPQKLKFDNSTKKRVDLAQLMRAAPGKELQWLELNVRQLRQIGLTTENLLTTLLATSDTHLSLQSFLQALLLNVNMTSEQKLTTLQEHVKATFKKSHLALISHLRTLLEGIRYDASVVNPVQAITTAFAQEGILLDDLASDSPYLRLVEEVLLKKLPTSVALQIESEPWRNMQKILHRYFTLSTARSSGSDPVKKVLVSHFDDGKSVLSDNTDELKKLSEQVSHLSGLVLQKTGNDSNVETKNCAPNQQAPVLPKDMRSHSKCFFCQADGHFARDCDVKRLFRANGWNVYSSTGDEVFLTSRPGGRGGGRSTSAGPWRDGRWSRPQTRDSYNGGNLQRFSGRGRSLGRSDNQVRSNSFNRSAAFRNNDFPRNNFSKN